MLLLTPHTSLGDGAPAPQLSADLLRSVRWCAAVAWVAWALSAGLLWTEHELRVVHPPPLVFLLLLVVTMGAALGGVARGVWRVARGPARRRAANWTALAVGPVVFWTALGSHAYLGWRTRNVPHAWPLILANRAACALLEDEAVLLHSHRQETDRLVMFYDDGIADPEGDLQAMDRHLARMEETSNLPLRAKVYWVRGPLLGRRQGCFFSVVLGSDQSAPGPVDRHQLAHALINQHLAADHVPPSLLAEGWAESQTTDRVQLAERAVRLRNFFENAARTSESQGGVRAATFADTAGFGRLLRKARETEGGIGSYLRELTEPFWYYRHTGPVYGIGGAFVDFLLHRFGPERVVRLYLTCRPGTFEDDCRGILGTDLDTLERQFWEEAEHLVRDAP